jgi:glycosyltransferase involved in cell wall biosynthesis
VRVLLVTPYFRPAHLGGIERAIERLAEALGRQDGMDRPAVLCARYAFPPRYVDGLVAREFTSKGPDIYRLSSWPHRPLPLFPYYSCPVTLFSTREVARVLRDYRPDVAHVVGDGWVWAHLTILARRAPRTAVVFTPSFHDLAGSRRWLRWPNTMVARQAERTVVLSSHEWRGVATAYRPRRDRLATVPWGASAPPIPSSSSSRPNGDNALIVLCVGRLGEHKGQAWLLDVYMRARPYLGRRVRLVLVGADEGDAGGRDALARRIAGSGLEGEVTLAGEVDDAELGRLYGAAALFVLFSRYEAFGLVYVEAMAHGVPVLTHDVGAVAEVLPSGAVIVPRYDVAAAVRALVWLVGDEAARRRLGADARALVEKAYSWDAVATRYRRVYEEAIDERRRATGAHT